MADNESSSSGSKEENLSQDSSSGSKEENPIQDSDLNSDMKTQFKILIGNIVERLRAAANLQHKFWDTQPVVQYKDFGNPSLPDGPIEQPTELSEVRQEPYNLPNEYEWTVCDMGSDEVCNEVSLLLKDHYVPNEDYTFRFNYSKEFLQWALRPPGYFPSWHIGVRAKSSKRLVAFIAAIPVEVGMKVCSEVVQMAEVNFLCVHKKLRSKRLAPVMIKEITRRIHLENVWQAAYTTSRLLPTPVSVCRYWRRQLNTKKLVSIGFSSPGERMTMSRLIKLYKLPDSTSTPGLREMELKDVFSVTLLLNNYMRRFAIAPIFDTEEVNHWFLPRENAVESYVVEDSETGDITDFFSFYAIRWSILNNHKYDSLKAAYSFYSVSTMTPLVNLMQDALIIATEKDFDVFYAPDVMDNEQYLMKLKFEQGEGQMYYYLYNYRLEDSLAPSELGILLLES